MKKCDFCAREISYHEMYCCEECNKKANDFYELQEKFSKLFSVLNGIFVMAIGILIFAFSFLPGFAVYGIAISLLVLAVLYFFCPFPPDVMIHKYKIKKSIKFCRIISLMLFTLSIITFICAIIFIR